MKMLSREYLSTLDFMMACGLEVDERNRRLTETYLAVLAKLYNVPAGVLRAEDQFRRDLLHLTHDAVDSPLFAMEIECATEDYIQWRGAGDMLDRAPTSDSTVGELLLKIVERMNESEGKNETM